MASVLDLVKHYQQNIEKHSNDEDRVLRCIDKLYQLRVTTQHLQETGVGRTVNALRKEPGDVGKAARSLVYKWKQMVAAEESDQEGDQRTDTAKHNGHSSGKESDDNTQTRSYKNNQYRNENTSPRTNREYQKGTNGHHSGSKRKYHSSEEEDQDPKKTRKYSSSEDDKRKVVIKQEKLSDSESEDDSESSDSSLDSESSREEIKIKKEIKQEHYIKKEIKTEPLENHKSSSSKHNSHHREPSLNNSHETEKRDHERSKSKELSRNNSETRSSSHKLKNSEDKNKDDRSEKKHKSDHKTQEEKKDSKSNKSSSEKHRSSSSHKSESNSDKHKNGSDSDKHKNSSERNHSDKLSSKSDKNRSSSHSDRERESEKHKSSEKDSKQRSKESSGSKDKHSSSSKDKSKDRTSSSKEKSSHSSEKKSSSESKSNDKSRHDKKHEKSKDRDKSSSSHRSKSNSSSKEEIPKKKSKQGGGNDGGIDCGSGASFAEALGMVISPAKPKKKTYKDLSPNINDLSPAALLAPTAKLAPLPALEISALPEISPNYRPRPPPKLLPHFTEEEAISAGISSKNQRTKVYSGNKVVGKVTSLYEMCVHILQEHIDALEYTGGVPYEILKPVVDRATPQQLFVLEHYNPYLMDDTDHLWQKFCERSFRNKRRQEMETWREMYMRCQEEQECKLKSLTANIRLTQEAKKAPIKQTKMAYVDSVVKPPRNIARKQALHGTAHSATASPAARVAALAAGPNVLKGGARAAPAPVTTPASSFKPKKAPLMQKALQFMRGRKR